nr:formylglycine-generating enzyme family protein [Myxococcales bacterium]
PDEVICDNDGFLAQRFGASKLPAAFLWSWDGQLLAQQSHVDDVEAKIQGWMRKAPRVEVEVARITRGVGIGERELIDAVRGELRRSDKLLVVATREERQRLRALVRESHRVGADESLACEVGAEVTANSLLKVSILGAEPKRLQLQLLSAERGCLVASASARWRPSKLEANIGEAVSQLFGRLRRPSTQYPWSKLNGSTPISRAVSMPTNQIESPLANHTESSPQAVGFSPSEEPTDYAAALREAEAPQKRREREERLRAEWLKKVNVAWEAVSKNATTSELHYSTRATWLEKFLRDYPDNNPYLAVAQLYLAALRAKEDPPNIAKDMVYIPGDTFTMGCQSKDMDSRCHYNEKPPHRVRMSPFHMDETEVTVAAYTQCVQAGICAATETRKHCNYDKAGRQEHPINCVTWYQAKKYCEAWGKRLPTEAEWEYAARAKDGDLYPWGNVSPKARRLEFGTSWRPYTTKKVKSYPVTAHGLYEMAGNVSEWVEDCYDSGIYKNRSDKVISDPLHQPKRCRSRRRVVRGGGVYTPGHLARTLRASSRLRYEPEGRFRAIGFRCASSALPR